MPRGRGKIVGIRWLSKAGLKKVLDSRARRVLGVSGATFEKNYSMGTMGAKSLDGKAGTLDLATLCVFTRGKRAQSKRKRSR
jgi:hypothetical protein